MFERTFNPGLAATILSASLILSACGGGGSSGDSGSSGGDATTLKAGLYEAKITYANGASPQTATTYLSPTGKFAVAFGGNAGLSIGKLAFDDTKISGTSNDYRQLDPAQPNPKGFVEDKGDQEGTINGTINSQGSATFSVADAAGQVNSTVTLQRMNFLSDLGISLSNASGNYTSSVADEADVVLTVGEDGSLYAEYYTLSIGCVLQGTETLTLSDTSINVFDITYTMSSCTNDIRNGEYSGVGFFGPSDGQTLMAFAAHNGEVAMQFQGTK